MIRTEKLRGLIRTITEHTGLQAALGGRVALNTLSNGLAIFYQGFDLSGSATVNRGTRVTSCVATISCGMIPTIHNMLAG